MTTIPASQTQPDNQVLEQAETKRYTHVVSPPENVEIYSYLILQGNLDPSPRDIVAIAIEKQWHVVALCGYTWIPTSEGESFDVCQICMDVAGMHMRNAGE